MYIAKDNLDYVIRSGINAVFILCTFHLLLCVTFYQCFSHYTAFQKVDYSKMYFCVLNHCFKGVVHLRKEHLKNSFTQTIGLNRLFA